MPAAPLATPASIEHPRWAGVVALSLGIFTLVTIEELPIGVLTLMSRDLGISEGIAGLSVTVPGVLAGSIAVFAPVLMGRLDRRWVLAAALASVIVSCLLTVLSVGTVSLLASRLFTGIAIGLYWPSMPLATVRQVPERLSARALTISFGGVGAAMVLGVPFASWIGTLLGWREAFIAVALIAAAALVAILLLVSPVTVDEKSTLGHLATALRIPGVQVAVVLAVVLVAAQFTTYSYVSPLLQRVVGIPVTSVSLMLLVFGIAGLAGNFLAAPLIERSPGRTLLLVAVGSGTAIAGILLLARGPIGAVVGLVVWGLIVGALSVGAQAFIQSNAGTFVEEATALNSAAFNVTIALGALIGGQITDRAGVAWTGWTSVALFGAAAAIAATWLSRHRDRPVLSDPR